MPITPYTDPDRFTEDEKARFDRGECGWQIAYGMPWSEYCPNPQGDGDFGFCPEHAREMRELYG